MGQCVFTNKLSVIAKRDFHCLTQCLLSNITLRSYRFRMAYGKCAGVCAFVCVCNCTC